MQLKKIVNKILCTYIGTWRIGSKLVQSCLARTAWHLELEISELVWTCTQSLGENGKKS